MIPQLMKALSKFLRATFPDLAHRVYYNYPEQDLDPPCFVIRTTGGNLKRRIKQDKQLRGISYERFTIEFYSMDILEIYDVGYQLKVLLDEIEIDNGDLYRCYNKNVMTALTENHFSMTFNIMTEPYVEKEPLIRMTSLDLDQQLEHEE